MNSLYPAFVAVTIMLAYTILPGAHVTLRRMGLHRSSFIAVLITNVSLLLIHFTEPQNTNYVGLNLVICAAFVLRHTWSRPLAFARVAFSGFAATLFMVRATEWFGPMNVTQHSVTLMVGWLLVTALFSAGTTDQLNMLAAVYVWLTILLGMAGQIRLPHYFPVPVWSSTETVNAFALILCGQIGIQMVVTGIYQFRLKKAQAVI